MPIEEYTKVITPAESLDERSAQSYARIMALDAHSPLETDAMRRVIDAIAPRYIVHELSARTPAEKAESVRMQLKSLRGCCP